MAKSKVGTPGYTAPGAPSAPPCPAARAVLPQPSPARRRILSAFAPPPPRALPPNRPPRTPPALPRTPAAAAEVISNVRGYDGKMADVWSAGVMLYTTLFARYPFERPEDKKLPQHDRLQRILHRIIRVGRRRCCVRVVAFVFSWGWCVWGAALVLVCGEQRARRPVLAAAAASWTHPPARPPHRWTTSSPTTPRSRQSARI